MATLSVGYAASPLTHSATLRPTAAPSGSQYLVNEQPKEVFICSLMFLRLNQTMMHHVANQDVCVPKFPGRPKILKHLQLSGIIAQKFPRLGEELFLYPIWVYLLHLGPVGWITVLPAQSHSNS